MKSLALIVLLLSAGSFAQEVIPPGTILPVQLNSSLRSTKLRPGQAIRARLMQDVPLGKWKIPAGAKVIGRVSAVQANVAKPGAQISLRFDQLVVKHRSIPVVTNLRALATMMDVSEAQVPESGPDRGTAENAWTTDQIGGETRYHTGPVTHGWTVVGRSVATGVLVRPLSRPGTNCRGEFEGNNQPQALWLFSSDACGLYDFPNLTLIHAGRTSPVGEITIASTKGEVRVRGGSGMLLRVNGQ